MDDDSELIEEFTLDCNVLNFQSNRLTWDVNVLDNSVTDEDKASISVNSADMDVSVDNFVTVISELISFWIAFKLLYIGTKSTLPPPPER